MSYEKLPDRRPLDYLLGPTPPRPSRTARFMPAMLILAIVGMAAMFAAAVCLGCSNG